MKKKVIEWKYFPKKRFGLFPIGWKDFGVIGDGRKIENGDEIVITKICSFDKCKLFHAQEGEIDFMYCPKCFHSWLYD